MISFKSKFHHSITMITRRVILNVQIKIFFKICRQSGVLKLQLSRRSRNFHSDLDKNHFLSLSLHHTHAALPIHSHQRQFLNQDNLLELKAKMARERERDSVLSLTHSEGFLFELQSAETWACLTRLLVLLSCTVLTKLESSFLKPGRNWNNSMQLFTKVFIYLTVRCHRNHFLLSNK